MDLLLAALIKWRMENGEWRMENGEFQAGLILYLLKIPLVINSPFSLQTYYVQKLLIQVCQNQDVIFYDFDCQRFVRI